MTLTMSERYAVLLLAALSLNASAVTVSIQMYIPAHCSYPTGSIYAQPQGGTEPYTYSWNTGSTEAWLYDLVAGTYSVTVTDANFDQATAEFTLTPWPFEAYVEGMVGCPDGASGPPFRLIGQSDLWTTGVPPLTLQGNYVSDVITGGPGALAALYVTTFDTWPAPGTPLSIPFTDVNGCPGTIFGTVPDAPAFPEMQVLSVDAACAGGNSGSALVQVDEAPNDDPYYIRLVREGSPYGYLANQYTNGQMYGQVPYSTLRQDLPSGEFALVTQPRFEDPWEWLGTYFNVIESYCTDTAWFTIPEMPAPCGTLRGIVHMDDNQDCVLAGQETRVPNEVLLIEPGGYTAMTNSIGYYQINLPTGSYTVEQASAVLDEHCVGGAIPFNLGSNGQEVTQNLADTALIPRDVELFLGSSAARPGFNHELFLHIHHQTLGGTGTVTVSCTFDPALSYTSASPAPSNVNGNTLTWTLAQLTSFGHRHISVNLQVPANPALIGTILQHSATVSIAQPETDLTNNNAVHTRTVTGSYDPNDKVARTSSGSSDAYYFIDQDEWIDYTIRFQNTGTDTAFNVVITDTLPPTLDPATFELGPRSHSCITQLGGQGVLRFIFNNIQLPDSNVNEPASHGLVQFRIRPRSPLVPGTLIENTANIHFDFNPPVITEPSVLVAEFSTGITADAALEFVLAPVPASDQLRIVSGTMIDLVTILAMDGRSIARQRVSSTTTTLDVSGLNSGAYLLITNNADGSMYRTPFTIVH